MYATLTHVHSPFMCSVGETKNVSDDFWVRSLFVQRRMLLVMHCHVGSLGCSLVRRFRGACCVCNTVTVFLFFFRCRLLLSRWLANCWDGGTIHCLPRTLHQALIPTILHTRTPHLRSDPVPSIPTLCPCLQWPFVQSRTPEPATWDPYLAGLRQVVGDLIRRC